MPQEQDAHMDRRETEKHWHLDKRVNITHVFTTVSLIGAMILWGTTVETRLSVLQTNALRDHETNKEIKQELSNINKKIDQMLIIFYRNRGNE